MDIIVVGRFSGSQALAAVGSTTALINVFTNLFIGVSLGANVLAARFYAAGKAKGDVWNRYIQSISLALISGMCRWACCRYLFFPDGALQTDGNTVRMSLICLPFICAFILLECRFLCFITMAQQFCGQLGIPDVALHVPDHFRCGKCGVKSDTRNRCVISAWRVLQSRTVVSQLSFLYSGFALSVYRTEGSYQLRFSKLCIKGVLCDSRFFRLAYRQVCKVWLSISPMHCCSHR